MKVAVPREIAPGERRVALVPDAAAALVKGGLGVLVESGAGEGAFHADAAFEKAGARIVPDAGTLYAQAGVDLTRIDEAISVIAQEFERMAAEPVPADELEKARSLAKGRFVLGTESPQGLILFGLRREVLEGEAIEPEEMLAVLDSVTVEDVQRVAQDLIAREKVHLAVIGPFDNEERFLSALS